MDKIDLQGAALLRNSLIRIDTIFAVVGYQNF